MFDLAGPSLPLVTPWDCPLLSQPPATWPFSHTAPGVISGCQSSALIHTTFPGVCARPSLDHSGQAVITTLDDAVPVLFLMALTIKWYKVICCFLCLVFSLVYCSIPSTPDGAWLIEVLIYKTVNYILINIYI